MDTRPTASAALVATGIGLFVAMVVVSAALAPSIGTATPGDGEARPTLVGSQGGGAGLHAGGSVYLLNGSSVAWREASADSYFDVTMLDNGSVMAGFMDSGYTDCGPYEPPCTHTGFRIIDPSPEPHVVYEYSFPVRTAKNSEVHDVELLPSGEFLITDMEHERIMTVKNGEITWQWNASSFYDAPADPTKVDWLHINDVDRIGEGRYLVSVRNANQLLIIERGDGPRDARVVEVINEDATEGDGVRRGDPGLLSHQHNPQWLGPGAVLVADSGNNRVVELHRNDAGEWQIAWYLTGANGIPFSWPRDADRLPNGHTLVTDSANQRIVEVNESGGLVWSYETPLVPYEAERLPVGETVGAPVFVDTVAPAEAATATPVAPPPNDGVPVLSRLLQVVQASYPLPFWLTEAHLFVTVVSLGLVGTGGALWSLRALRARRR